MSVWDKLASSDAPLREKPEPAPIQETLELRERIIAYYRQENLRGLAPRVREVGAAVGLRSNSTVSEHLRVLAEAGRLQREANCRYYLTSTPLAEALAILREFEPMKNYLPEPTRTQFLNLLKEFPK